MGSNKIYLCMPVVVVLVRVYHAFTCHFGILLGGKNYPKGKFASTANTMALNNAINVASNFEITWLTSLIILRLPTCTLRVPIFFY